MKNFIKGLLGGIGNITPGLSGSAILIILGVYENCIHAISNIFKDFKFAQNVYSTEPMQLQYFKQVSENNYGQWVTTETTMLTL